MPSAQYAGAASFDHASVAFVRDDAQGSGFGHAKVHPLCHIRRQENWRRTLRAVS